jgi:hypothetical protein
LKPGKKQQALERLQIDHHLTGLEHFHAAMVVQQGA